MNQSLISSMVSMSAMQKKLDVIANNVANVNTNGYKRKEATFTDIFNQVRQQPEGHELAGRMSPLGINHSAGARLNVQRIDLSQGPLLETGLNTDIAIEGNALFELQVAGAPGATAFTRAGSFRLIPRAGDEENVYLATADGHYVKNSADDLIRVSKHDTIVVTEDGRVFAHREGQYPDRYVADIKLVRPLREQYLQEAGDNIYIIPDGMNRANVVQTMTSAGLAAQGIALSQGFLEGSNVQLLDETMELMMVQRAFQLSSRAVQSSDTMMSLANNLRA